MANRKSHTHTYVEGQNLTLRNLLQCELPKQQVCNQTDPPTQPSQCKAAGICRLLWYWFTRFHIPDKDYKFPVHVFAHCVWNNTEVTPSSSTQAWNLMQIFR